MAANNNREDVTHVKIEDMSFSNRVIIYTEGLVTLHGCTLHKWTHIFMYKSHYETDFTYKTAEMIPSVIKNKTINIISTGVHDDLFMYLLSGIRTVNILNSDFVSGNLLIVAGNKSVESVSSHHLTVLNISITNTTFTNYDFTYWAYGRDSIISMKTIYSKYDNIGIYQFKGAGYFGAVIENSKFHKCIVLLQQVISVSITKCEYEVSD